MGDHTDTSARRIASADGFVPARGRLDAGEADGRMLWLSADAAIAQLDRMDLAAFREAVEELAEVVTRLAADSPQLASIFLYDVLRTTAERLTLGAAGVDEAQRLVWMNGLAAAKDLSQARGFFLDEVDRLLTPFRSARTRINPVVLRARRFIEEHADEKIGLSRVAEAVGVARNYLSSLFRKECGTTLTAFIHEVRIERAQRLLRAGARSLAEVAAEVGYQNYRHFYRSFLKISGVSPTRYLRELRRGGEQGTELLASRLDDGELDLETTRH